jgi:hypothetical protein
LKLGRFERATEALRLAAERDIRWAAGVNVVQPEDALPTIAEIAITFAGFVSVALAFRPSTTVWSEAEAIRIQGFFITTATVVLCAFLPFGLIGLSNSPAIVWGVPLCFYAVTGIYQNAFFSRKIASGAAIITAPSKATIPSLVVSAALQLLALLSGLGLVFPYSAGLLVLALVSVLLLNIWTLARLLAVWIRQPAAQQSAAADSDQS